MEGNGDKAWKTSKEQTKIPRFMLEGPLCNQNVSIG